MKNHQCIGKQMPKIFAPLIVFLKAILEKMKKTLQMKCSGDYFFHGFIMPYIDKAIFPFILLKICYFLLGFVSSMQVCPHSYSQAQLYIAEYIQKIESLTQKQLLL